MTHIDSEKSKAMTAAIEGIRKNWQGLKSSTDTWNQKKLEQHLEKLAPLIQSLNEQWDQLTPAISASADRIAAALQADDYRHVLENELQANGVPASGEWPEYVLPPYKLSVHPEAGEARLSLGRKIERTNDLEPAGLARWVSVRYKKVQARRFHADKLLKDLLEAYQVALQLQHPVEWADARKERRQLTGLAVPILTIYKLMTLKASTRQDYPRQFFDHDLGLLAESGVNQSGKFRYELGFARDQKRAVIVVDSSGRENYIASLTVHEVEEA